MSCQKHKALLERWWNDQLTAAEKSELEAQLASCEDCRQELAGSRELWDLMTYMPVPEPSGDMQNQFNSMLDAYKASPEGRQRPNARGWTSLWALFLNRPGVAMAFSLLLLLGGAGIGWAMKQPKPATPVQTAGAGQPEVAAVQNKPAEPTTPKTTIAPPTTNATPPQQTPTSLTPTLAAVDTKPSNPTAESRQLAELTAQVHEMRSMMMLSLLQNPAASERIKAVSYTSEIHHVDPNIAEALLTTLNNDPNVNVRLTTLEALTHFAHDPVIREGLVTSILQQESPLVQAAMADVMLQLQEKRAVPSFEKLLQHKDLNEMVRTKIEQTIVRLT